VAGRKGVSYYRFRRRELTETWTGVSDQPRYDDARQIAETVLTAFLEREVDEIHMVYADFRSTMVQRPTAVRVIPLVVEEGEERPPQPLPMYVFEPDVSSVLDALLPRYVAARMFTAMLESAASEWAARRRAMSAATDNAEQLVELLTREYNQARQAAITQEIMEIVGGAEALQQSGS
jgi:F-type H+-transporting ATPase subunit gamma